MMAESEPGIGLVVAGHVDHGKSTLIGRLLYELDALPPEARARVEAASTRRGRPLEWAFLLDAFQAERDQGVTIDSSRVRFHHDGQSYRIIDAPGHREFITNMVAGAADADAALLLVDAADGVREQTRRHASLLHLLGLSQIIVVVNKMDLVNHDQSRFAAIADEVRSYLGELGLTPLTVVPVAAATGANVTQPAATLAWHHGDTVLSALARLTAKPSLADQPFRLPVQHVYRVGERRLLAGRVTSGKIKRGDPVVLSPSNRLSAVAAVETWPPETSPAEAMAGQSIALELTDDLFVERGEVVSHEADAPMETNVFAARLVWLGQRPLEAGDGLTIKLGTARHPVIVEAVRARIDPDTLARDAGGIVSRHGIAEVLLRTPAMAVVEMAGGPPALARFVLLDGFDVVAGGTVDMHDYPDQRLSITRRSSNLTPVLHKVTADMRVRQKGHQGGVLWFTGLSGSGKSTLAIALEQALFRRGYHVYVLDGDNVRAGLNSNLGFTPEDRAENIRRVGEVAALFADAGEIVISAFISPYRADRERARQAAGSRFHEVHLSTDVTVCEERDPKGLYARARRGEIADFTGISAPYEAPDSAELVLDTASASIDHCLETLVEYVTTRFRLDSRSD
ncbi:MAG: adenylyl-sulfate kinase [Alphaproteobacteria bacterium]